MYKSEDKLQRHYNHNHNDSDSEKVHSKCNVCTKSFKTKQNLAFHIKTVHGRGKQYNCESCAIFSSN